MNEFEITEEPTEYIEPEPTPLEIAIKKGEARRQTAETVAALEAEIVLLKKITLATDTKLASFEKTVVPVKEVLK